MRYQRINATSARLLQLSAYTLLLLVVMLAVAGCTALGQAPQPPQKPSPPADMPIFTFDPIEVQPASPMAGQSFNISMKVANTGTAAGTYKADLIINSKSADNRALYLDTGKAASLTFQATLPVPGQYIVKIGPQSKEIFVGFNRIPITLRLDSGNVDGCDTLAGSTGQPGNMIQMVEGNLLKMTAPADGFEINNLDIFGYIKSSDHDYNSSNILGPGTWSYGIDISKIEPSNSNFTLNIYDARKTRLFSGDFSKGLFTYYPRWVSVQLPIIKVSGDFYIELITHNQPKLFFGGYDSPFGGINYVNAWYHQVCIGYENSLDVRSWVSQDGNIVSDRYLTYNWLMRASGYQVQK